MTVKLEHDKSVCLEDLVQRVVWGKAFVDSAQKFLSTVCFHVGVPWGVVPSGVSFSVLFHSSSATRACRI